MLIDCPGCGASYHITRAALGPKGRKVACARCNAVWLAQPAALEAEAQILAAAVTADRFDLAKASDYARSVAAPVPPPPQPRIPPFLQNFCAGALLLAIAMGLIASRGAIARAWPGTARLYAAMGMPVPQGGLAIRDLHSVLMRIDGAPYLGIEGIIVNLRREQTPLPSVRLAIRDANKHELYVWTVALDRAALPAGETLMFRARLAEPPPDGRDVIARFMPANRTMASR